MIDFINCYRSSQTIIDSIFDVLAIANTRYSFELNNVKLISTREKEVSKVEIRKVGNVNSSHNSFLRRSQDASGPHHGS